MNYTNPINMYISARNLQKYNHYVYLKTSSSKPAISIIIEEPENEINYYKIFCQVFNVIASYLNKVSKNASINK